MNRMSADGSPEATLKYDPHGKKTLVGLRKDGFRKGQLGVIQDDNGDDYNDMLMNDDDDDDDEMAGRGNY